jgi:hypothetical protein
VGDIKGLIDEFFLSITVYCGFKMEVEVSVHKLLHKEERDHLFNSYRCPSGSVRHRKWMTPCFR